jgi:adenylate cyclase
MKYKGMEKSVSEIGKELEAGVLVEGSVRKAGNRIRVTVQVINANNEEHLWASNYDNTLDDIFAVQEEIASKVSESLPNYVLDAKPHIQTSQEPKSVPAYTYYLKGLQLFNEGTDDSIRKALEFFTNATKLDPSFARAYVEIGNCYAQLGMRSYISQPEGAEGMKKSAERAMQIDPNLAEAHSLLSFYAWAMDDFELEEKEARKALELNSNLADAQFNLARLRMTLGYPRSALKILETAYSLDPLSGQILRYYSLMLSWMQRESEAQDLWRRNLKSTPFEVHTALAEYMLGKRDLVRAEEEIHILEALSPVDFNTISFRAYLQAMKGDSTGMQNSTEILRRTFKGGATYERTLGYLKYLTGDMDGFFEAMFRAVNEHVLDPFRIRYSPMFDKARQDPRMRELLEKNGIGADLKEPL